jgi:hypothetical protein
MATQYTQRNQLYGCDDAATAAGNKGRGSMNTSDPLPICYRIRIRGHLDPSWSDWFDGLAITQEIDGTTTLAGSLTDQAALYGLLSRLRDLGATLLAVERLLPGSPC